MNKYVIMFKSRNKDNQGLLDFKERTRAFLVNEDYDENKVREKFNDFIAHGVKGETCRWYITINTRNPEVIKKHLIAELALNDELDIAKIENKVISIAQRPECAATKHWMFDVDVEDENIKWQIINELRLRATVIEINPTPHGCHVIVERGFDTREIIEKWKDYVTLHRDDYTLKEIGFRRI